MTWKQAQSGWGQAQALGSDALRVSRSGPRELMRWA